MGNRTSFLAMTPDRVHEALAARQFPDLRFRAAFITSASLHVGIALTLLITPLLLPAEALLPSVTPVRLVQLRAQRAASSPVQPDPEQAPEPAPEPAAVLVTEPEPVPRDLEALRRERLAAAEADRKRKKEEAAARRRAAAEKRRREEEERRRREEEERRKPQSARRSSQSQEPALVSQSAQRHGSIGVVGAEQTAGVTIEDFQFNYYLEILLDKIAARWAAPKRGPYAKPLTTVAYFRVDRNGNLVVQPQIKSTAGQRLFDQAALRAIVEAAPFPPLPQGYEGNSLGVNLAFKQEQ
ncbi:MAG: TonB C-terminal domain-containing protein [Acidobacteriota bacterium]